MRLFFIFTFTFVLFLSVTAVAQGQTVQSNNKYKYSYKIESLIDPFCAECSVTKGLFTIIDNNKK